MKQSWKELRHDWDELFYRFLCRGFGYKVNADPFEMLAGRIPYSILRRHQDHLHQAEALLYGAAGMLEGEFKDPYPLFLKNEFVFLGKKFGIRPMNPAAWKFMRLHPPGFPTYRISQLASLLHLNGRLFSRFLETEDFKSAEKILELESNEYWDDKFRFDRHSERIVRQRTGKSMIRVLLINSIIPILFLYGKESGESSYCDKALTWLSAMEAEDNTIVREWLRCGISAGSALESQALIQLRNRYCTPRRCLECGIGAAILSHRPERKQV